jgi:hypothetical protein
MKKEISNEEFNRQGLTRKVENALDGITEQERQQRELRELIEERLKTAVIIKLLWKEEKNRRLKLDEIILGKKRS